MRAYILSILYKNTLEIFTEPQDVMQCLKNIHYKLFLLKPERTRKIDITHSEMYNNW